MVDVIPGWQLASLPEAYNIADEQRTLFETAVARNYIVRAETQDREGLRRILPQVGALIRRARAGLADDLGECSDLADRMRGLGIDLVHLHPRSLEEAATDLQHAQVLSFIRSLQRFGQRASIKSGGGIGHYWRIV
jgi:hypothetical protein